jgi:hypothetical protein
MAASSAMARGGVPGQHIRNPPEKSLSVSRPSRNYRVAPSALAARTGGELLREFFGTLRADFGTLCPFRSHLGNSAAKRESEERADYQRLLARRSE